MRPQIGEWLRDTAEYFMLAWSGDDVIHCSLGEECALKFAIRCGEAIRSCCNFPCYMHYGIGMRA